VEPQYKPSPFRGKSIEGGRSPSPKVRDKVLHTLMRVEVTVGTWGYLPCAQIRFKEQAAEELLLSVRLPRSATYSRGCVLQRLR
jgi:hypothetical protein